MHKTTLRLEITFSLELPDLLGARTVGISLLHDLEKQPRCLNPNINGCLWTFSTCTLLWNQQNRRLTAANWVPSTQNTHISEVVAAHHMLPSDGRLSGSNAMSGKTSTISCTSSCHGHDGLKFDWISGPTRGRSFHTCRRGLKLSQLVIACTAMMIGSPCILGKTCVAISRRFRFIAPKRENLLLFADVSTCP